MQQKNKGMVFGQNMIAYEHEIQKIAFRGSNIYRALCELDGDLCIIKSYWCPVKLFIIKEMTYNR